jgi:hypothetical protein
MRFTVPVNVQSIHFPSSKPKGIPLDGAYHLVLGEVSILPHAASLLLSLVLDAAQVR